MSKKIKNTAKAQYTLFDEIYVDNFAGGGGASTGIELATGHPVDIAINHDESAILLHKRNHPYTEHYREDVWQIDPVAVCRGRKVRLAWFSPDCKHFSRAKGAALVDKKIRGLAWIVLKWAALVRPDVIMLENVPEFVTWGPVRKGRPVKKKAGQTFAKWKQQLEDLGYKIEYKELCAADYGAPTIRTRFCLVARCDGRPIVFPEPTHAPRNSEAVKSGKLKPWRAAAEIIDFSLPCYSIFKSKKEIKDEYGVNAVRPLADKTLRRIAKGLDKFVIKSAEPFIVPIGYGERAGQTPRVHDIKEPLSTVVSSTKQYLCDTQLTPFVMSNNSGNAPHDLLDPMPTVTTGDRNYNVTPVITPYSVEANHGGDGHTRDIKDPLGTVTAKCSTGVVEPILAPFHMHNHQNAVGTSMNDPVNTITSAGQQMLIAPHLIQYHTEQKGDKARGQAVIDPLMTVDGSNRYGLSAVYMTEYFSTGRPLDVKEPMHTLTGLDRENLVCASISKYFTGVDGASAKEPLPTVTAIDHNSLMLSHLAHFKGEDKGQDVRDPLMTITATDGQFGEIRTKMVKWDGQTELYYWRQVRAMLNTFCDYSLADDEILLLNISGAWYFISDIRLRMFSPRELYNAMGFPADYIIDRDKDGNAIPRDQQVAKCGNAVCPAIAEAMTRANLPECCTRKLGTMAELHEEMIS